MKKKLLLGLILFTGVLSAQTEFRSGYIIKKNKDTVYGEIDYRSDYIMSKVCKFKKDEKTIEYRPNDLKSYRFTNGKFFVSQEVNGKAVFLQFLVKGELNAYYLSGDEGKKYFLENEEGGLREVPTNEKERISIDGAFYSKKSTVHYSVLSMYTKDAPELKNEISNMKFLNHRNVISLAKNYHIAVCDTEECIIYEEKSRKSHFNIELVGGFLKFIDAYALENSFQKGVLVHASIPALGDKWYFKTGILFSKLEYEKGSDDFFRYPVHIEYIHPKGTIRPRFSYGFSFSNYLFMSYSLDAGFNVKMTDKLFLSVGTEFLFSEKYIILPDLLYGYSINVGLFYKF